MHIFHCYNRLWSKYQVLEDLGSNSIDRYIPATFLCLFQTIAWIFIGMCDTSSRFCIQKFVVRLEIVVCFNHPWGIDNRHYFNFLYNNE